MVLRTEALWCERKPTTKNLPTISSLWYYAVSYDLDGQATFCLSVICSAVGSKS